VQFNCVKKLHEKLNWLCVGFPEWTAQFCVWKTTGKDGSEACAIASQNCAVYSVLPLCMTSHSKIAHFNWDYIAPFTPCLLVSVCERFCRQNTTVHEARTVFKPDSSEQIFKLLCPVPHWIRRQFNLNTGFRAFVFTYLLHGAVLLEKLTGLQLVKKFPAFHGTRSFITALTSVRHLSLSWASPIQSIYPHPTSWRSILISTHLRLGPFRSFVTSWTHLNPWAYSLLC